jgi:acid phosphatase
MWRLWACLGFTTIGLLADAPSEPFRLLALGDWGWADPTLEHEFPVVRKYATLQRSVAAAMARYAQEEKIQGIISVGDNFYPNGVTSVHDSRWVNSFEKVYDDKALQVPWYVALGNHDFETSFQAQIDYTEVSKGHWVMPARYFTHDFPAAQVRLIVLDNCSLSPVWGADYATPAGQEFARKEWTWLEAELAKPARWKLVVGHIPVRSHGLHGEDAVFSPRAAALFQKYGVQLYLNGHDHHAEVVRDQGITYVTCGNSADLYPVLSTKGSDFIGTYAGFTALKILPDRLELKLIDTAGQVRYLQEIKP